jgi:hypothetical protein
MHVQKERIPHDCVYVKIACIYVSMDTCSYVHAHNKQLIQHSHDTPMYLCMYVFMRICVCMYARVKSSLHDK